MASGGDRGEMATTDRVEGTLSYPKLIGLCGQAGAGKDLVAALLKMRGYKRYGFADTVREEVHVAAVLGEKPLYPDFPSSVSLQIAWELVQTNTLSIREKPMNPHVRGLLQWWGTEYRRAQDPEYWIEKLARKISNDSVGNTKALVISDVRFLNEATFIRDSMGGGEIWKIHRPGLVRDSHISENEFTGIKEDRFLSNSGNLQHLASQVIEALESSRA